MKFVNFLKYGSILWLGSAINSILFHFRFNNEILRRELIIFMQERNNYFIMFTIADLLFFLLFGGTYLLFRYKEKKVGGAK